MYDNILKEERALAISIVRKGSDRQLAREHLTELISLAETAGAEIIDTVTQELVQPIPATAIGKGKIEEVKHIIEVQEIQLVIFDDDLTPKQVKNLEQEFEIKVTDRSGLILDIFAKHARTVEAKTQVELAQLQYLLPRLTRMWTHLERQFGGGIGMRGPGETQIETDRRLIRIRIQKLKDKLEEIAMQKEQQKKGRESLPKFALVGYTNAGKSTLMNAVTASDVLVENKLFATLDTTIRAFELPSGQKALLSDTVGFIRKLPAHLVASFRSTLSEAADADILLHVVDISHPYFREHIQTVAETLEYLKLNEKPLITIFNKIDMLPPNESFRSIENDYPNSIFISAERGINLKNLLNYMQSKYDEYSKVVKFVLPYSNIELISKVYNYSEVLERQDKDEGIELEVRIPKDNKEYFEHYFRGFLDGEG